MRTVFALVGISFSIACFATGIYITVANAIPKAQQEGAGWVFAGVIILGLTWKLHRRMRMNERSCEICRTIIPQERAEALPETKLCIKHAQEIEKYGGEFQLTATQETTSKVGSLKKNYGGIDVTKKRNTGAVEKLRDAYEKKK